MDGGENAGTLSPSSFITQSGANTWVDAAARGYGMHTAFDPNSGLSSLYFYRTDGQEFELSVSPENTFDFPEAFSVVYSDEVVSPEYVTFINPEPEGTVAHGQLTITDPDTGESSFEAATVPGDYGTLDIDSSGSWTYTVDNNLDAVQSLAAGEELPDSIDVTSYDGTVRTINITITGTNDGPVLSGPSPQATMSEDDSCLLYTSPSPRDAHESRMPSSA